MQNKKNYISVLLFVSLLVVTAALPATRATEQSPGATRRLAAMGNPAAVYCKDVMGYEYQIVEEADGGQRGVCVLPSGQGCGQWDFYAGTCGQEHNYCAQQGHGTETRSDGQDPFSANYAVCVSPEGQEIGPVTTLTDLSARAAGPCTAGSCTARPCASELPTIDADAPSPQIGPAAPSSFNWRSYGGSNWLTSVKNQQSCGSCWAFAAVGVVEAHYNIVNNNPGLDLNLAEQDLVSCSGAGSCSGGSASVAMHYIRDDGIVDEGCFSYTASDSACSKCAGWQNRLTYVDELSAFGPSRDTIRQAVVDYGPVYAYMGINSDYGGYFDGSGIYRCTDDSDINHGVVIVGYNDAGGYWIVRNSWGSDWPSGQYHDGGYFKVGYGECAIDSTYAGYTYLAPPTKASNVRPDGWSGPYTNDSTPRFQWNAGSDSGSGMAGYYVAVDDWTPEGGYNNDWWVGNVTAFTVPSALSDGQHHFAVTSKDRFGNVNPSNTNQQGDAPYYTFYVDTTPPSSAVSALAAEQSQASFVVHWSGTDATSDIVSYDVQYRLGVDGSWVTWISGSSSTAATFKAQGEGTYYFRSRARDRVGNVEAWPSSADTSTYVHMSKIYLPLMLKNYAPPTGEPYLPVGELVIPTDDILATRSVAEKDGYAYLLARDGVLYTYNVADLSTRNSFTTFRSPVSTLNLPNDNGLLRNGNYLYVFGYEGLTVLSIHNPAYPSVVRTRNDLTIYNLVHHGSYLIAPGYGSVGVYSAVDPANPTLLSSYNVAAKYFFSAAVYQDTLYTSEFETVDLDYIYGFRVLDFSDPANPSLLHFIDRDSAAYHMHIVGETLVACHTYFVETWNLDTPGNPLFSALQSTRARSCAVDNHNHIITNGDVFSLNGSTLQVVTSFEPGYIQADGFPYGSVVSDRFVFISQSPRVLILQLGRNAAFAVDPMSQEPGDTVYQQDGFILSSQ